jgi:hypothetical protein
MAWASRVTKTLLVEVTLQNKNEMKHWFFGTVCWIPS